jgi:hypothetical protein
MILRGRQNLKNNYCQYCGCNKKTRFLQHGTLISNMGCLIFVPVCQSAWHTLQEGNIPRRRMIPLELQIVCRLIAKIAVLQIHHKARKST